MFMGMVSVLFFLKRKTLKRKGNLFLNKIIITSESKPNGKFNNIKVTSTTTQPIHS